MSEPATHPVQQSQIRKREHNAAAAVDGWPGQTCQETSEQSLSLASRLIFSLISKRGVGVVPQGLWAVDFLSLASVGTI